MSPKQDLLEFETFLHADAFHHFNPYIDKNTVSWCFKPSQPQGITSGLAKTQHQHVNVETWKRGYQAGGLSLQNSINVLLQTCNAVRKVHVSSSNAV